MITQQTLLCKELIFVASSEPGETATRANNVLSFCTTILAI